MVGTVIWTAILIVWTVVYQTQSAKWLPCVDSLLSGIPCVCTSYSFHIQISGSYHNKF